MSTSIIFISTWAPSPTSFSSVGTFWPRRATDRPKREANTIRGSRCSRESRSGKSFTVKAPTRASPICTSSSRKPPVKLISPPCPRTSAKGFQRLMRPKEKIPVIRDIPRKTQTEVPSTRPMTPFFLRTTSDWATEKNTSGTTSTKTRLRNKWPTGRSTAASSPSTTPSTPPMTRPASRRSVEP